MPHPIILVSDPIEVVQLLPTLSMAISTHGDILQQCTARAMYCGARCIHTSVFNTCTSHPQMGGQSVQYTAHSVTFASPIIIS